MWFAHGELPPVRAALDVGLNSGAISVEVWLQVIPQLIARIHTQASATRSLLHRLLERIGAAHPQALIYPLTVSCKSATVPRRTAAMQIMRSIRQRWPGVVDQAELVSRELIRVAILWHEMWHSGLEEASRQYFGEGSIQGMLSTLLPLHEMLSSPGPVTLRETAFVQAYGADLAAAHRWLLDHQRSGRVSDLLQAWEIYNKLYKSFSKMLQGMPALELQLVSPALLAAHDLELCVPGTYTAHAPIVRIMSFCPAVDVISSKQRPRKVTLLGSDGRQYTFLLKGHEDLRQDERVMQLFGLVNTLLANDTETSRRDLSVRRYAVTPLSHDVGVVGWVPNSDTLHQLIREHREGRKVLLNIEHRLMLMMAPMHDSLGVLQKVEVFRSTMENTTGQDLYKILWLKSPSSEVWLERRTAYSRTLAVMSIVGYILGLGDRHPSNIMLDRYSGGCFHIDFGDCFEVAMTRDKFPERVPFRLTRMLVSALEVSGIEGSYRSTCEAVMRVLRLHRDSLMAMLEAFAHDPLINWRLLEAAAAAQPPPGGTAAAAPAVGAGPAAPPATRARQGSNAAAQQSSVAGARRLGEAHPEAAATLLQQGLAFARLAEDAALDAALAGAGVAAGSAALGGGADGAHMLARSFATSVRAPPPRPPAARDGVSGGAVPEAGGGQDMPEALNDRAVAVIRRINAKLTGRDFSEDDPIARLMSGGIDLAPAHTAAAAGEGSAVGGISASPSLDVPAQVLRLISAATSTENLSQCYIGWCAFW